jgi:hypothetical protein
LLNDISKKSRIAALKKQTKIESQNYFYELGLLNTMAGNSFGLKGKVKTETFSEKWIDSKSGYTTKKYYNKEGFVIKEEYQNEFFESTSVYKYKNKLLISEKSKDRSNKMISHCEFTYYENEKIKSSKQTRIKEDSDNNSFEVEKEFFFFSLDNKLIKRETNRYDTDASEAKIISEHKSYSTFDYDERNRIIKINTFVLPNNECTYMHTNTYNQLDQIIEDKTLYNPRSNEKYSSKYTYDKKGEILTTKRYKNGVQINLDDKKTVFSDKKEFDKTGNLIKKTVYKNSKVMYTQEYKFEYYITKRAYFPIQNLEKIDPSIS